MSSTKFFRFGNARVDYHFDSGMPQLRKITDPKTTILVTDEHVYAAHTARFKGWNVIVLKPGEEYKIQQTVDAVIDQLIEMGADRKYTLVGVGGGVITDITGYVASVYMRGIRFGFIPTSLLALVDASIGGKNGIDVGIYKNMVGIIRQPAFLLHDLTLLKSLPEAEWENGFAEVIKHACIKDAPLFSELESASLKKYRSNKKLLAALVQRNVLIKTKVVLQDEFEKGERRLLNFGHTLAHALENSYELSHGQAVAIGMTYAAELSERVLGFRHKDRVVSLLEKYQLPTYAAFDRQKALEVLQKDKKKESGIMNYILLKQIGKALVYPIPIPDLNNLLLTVS